MTGYNSAHLRHDCDYSGCFVKSLPAWDDIIGCFPRGIRPTDIDGAVEIGGHVLIIEQKNDPGTALQNGQQRALLALSRKPNVTVLCLRPGLGSEEQMLVLRDGKGTGWQPRARWQVLDWIRAWAADADWGSCPTRSAKRGVRLAGRGRA